MVRSNAANALVQAGGAQAEPLLVTTMGDKDSAARAALYSAVVGGLVGARAWSEDWSWSEMP